MASFDEEIRLDEEENRRELAYIRTQMPSTIKKFYSDKDILYMMDVIVDYYFTSGILESDDEEVEIDLEVIAEYVCKRVLRSILKKCFSSYRLIWISRNRMSEE